MDDTPSHFLCPITTALMQDPVIDSDGHSYERTAIEQWVDRHHASPLTRKPLQLSDLRPNRALREAIEAWQRGSAGGATTDQNNGRASPSASFSLRKGSSRPASAVAVDTTFERERSAQDGAFLCDGQGQAEEEQTHAAASRGVARADRHPPQTQQERGGWLRTTLSWAKTAAVVTAVAAVTVGGALVVAAHKARKHRQKKGNGKRKEE